MPQVRVNVFTGGEAQIPQIFDVIAETYQDVVTSLINYGIESGQIYTVDGNFVDYSSPITLGEVNYIIPDGPIAHFPNLRKVDRITYPVDYKVNGTVRDLYNKLVAKGLSKNLYLVLSGQRLDLDTPLRDLNLPMINNITIVIPRS